MEELPKLQSTKLSAVPIGAGCVDGKWITIDPTPGSIDGVLGWPSRIIVFWLYMQQIAAIEVSVVRQSSGQVYVLGIGPLSATPNQLTGWEKDRNGQTTPTTVNLAPLMDPKRLAAEATELNLKLMKWRLLPLLDLDTFHNSRALLFGAGTLGCNVTRLLLVLFYHSRDFSPSLGVGMETYYLSGQWKSIIFKSRQAVPVYL